MIPAAAILPVAWTLAQAAAAAASVGPEVPWEVIVPQLAGALVILVLWIKGLLLAKPHVDRLYEQIEQLEASYRSQIERLEASYQEQIDRLKREHRDQLAHVERLHQDRTAAIVATYEDRIQDLEKVIERATAAVEEEQRERRAAHELLTRSLGVAEKVVHGS